MFPFKRSMFTGYTDNQIKYIQIGYNRASRLALGAGVLEDGKTMNEIDIADDDKLRFIQRVLESAAPEADRLLARNMIVEIRTRVRTRARKAHADGVQEDGNAE